MHFYELFARATRYLISKDKSLGLAEKEQIQDMLTAIEKVLTETEYIPVLTFEAAIRYFKTHAPKDQLVKKGLLLREKTRKGLRIIQIFVDEHGEIIIRPDKKDIPYGRQVPIGGLDEELTAAFGDADLIIVE